MKALARRPAAALAVSPALVQAAQAFASRAISDATRRAYRQQWATFAEWARRNGLEALPAAPATLALYLTARAQGGAKVATLEQALAAISQAHSAARLTSPRSSAEARLVMRGIKRTVGTAQTQKAPLLIPALRAMVAGLQPGITGSRDKALLLLGFSGAFRRAELVSLDVEDLVFDSEGLRVKLRRSKTDQEAKGVDVPIPFGDNPETCPVRAVREWLDASKVQGGPLFRAISRAGRARLTRLTDKSVALVVKKHASAAGLEASSYSGHSLRSGLATAAAKAGKAERDIGRQTRHVGTKTLRRYIRDAHLFQGNAAKGIGL